MGNKFDRDNKIFQTREQKENHSKNFDFMIEEFYSEKESRRRKRKFEQEKKRKRQEYEDHWN